ncbi:zinc finger protein 160-like isoform X2 [Vanessa atalanta]|uniref:zinc finger protein 160-like isoform X2 n=1 Tax=Vanessa atalanta TaxID=42275 RepID=UPI001FCCE86E|nr:zinc finger protein 160-like isoform X2 [Vanessa atalanta]
MEFDEIVVKESPGLCRCCLSEGCYKDLGTEYAWMDETEVYADMLLECFDISISQHMEGPNGPNRLICEVCITRLRDACNFKKQVLDSEKKFVDMVGRGEFKSKVIVYQEQMKSEMIMEPQPAHDADVEYLDEEIDYDDGNKDDSNEPTVSEDITVDALPIKGKRGRPKKTTVKPEKKKSKLEEKAKPKIVKGVDGPAQSLSPNTLRRRNLLILFNNTSIIPFKCRGKCRCFYCGEELPIYDDLRKHTKAHGPCSERDRAIKLVKTDDAEVKIDVSDITCELCNESFGNLDEIISHLTTEHMFPYERDVKLIIMSYRLIDKQCLICDERFKQVRELVIHVNNEHPVQCFDCDVCQQKFFRKQYLDAHMRVKHSNIYKCLKCPQTFSSHLALQEHKIKSHVAVCNICFTKFSTQMKRLKHMKSEHANEPLKCGFCLKFMSTKLGFLRHAAKCTEKNENVNETFVVDDDDEDKKPAVIQIRKNIACIFNMSTVIPFKYFMSRFRCFYCPHDFTDCEELRAHTVIEHPICDVNFKCMRLRNRQEGCVKVDTSVLSCKMCFENLPNLESLIEHLISEHKALYDKSVDNNIQPYNLIKDNYPCPVCGESYTHFSTLLKHMGQLHTDNKNICMHCGKSFRNLPNLRVHISNHHKTTGSYKCVRCEQEFSTNKYLQTHLGRAHGIKVYECPECSEKFTSNYAMQRHMINTHSSGHKCLHCGKLFTSNCFMIDHIKRTHLKEKNVECQVCYERFFDTQRLKTHMVKHNGERNFHCDVCGKKFLWKKNLRGHMAIHVKNINQELPA